MKSSENSNGWWAPVWSGEAWAGKHVEKMALLSQKNCSIGQPSIQIASVEV